MLTESQQQNYAIFMNEMIRRHAKFIHVCIIYAELTAELFNSLNEKNIRTIAPVQKIM